MRQRCLRLVLALCAALLAAVAPLRAQQVPPAVLEAEQQRIEAIARAVEASVSVFGHGGRGGGSGVVITPDGYALTNYHVVRPAGDYMKCSMPDGQLYDAVIVGVDPTGDVAMIKLLGRDDFPHATLGDSDQVQMGDWCFAVGNPFLLATDFQPTISYGIVSGVHRYQYPAGTLLEYTDCIQTDAAINPGNSGGPLFNSRGELIGINGRGSFEKRGRVNVGVGYAISINQIKNFLGYLRSGRIVDHATLGATVSTDETGAVVVTNILSTSDAYRRGLRYGDEIVAFGGRPITTVNGFKNVLGIFPKGWRVPLSFRHEGERYDVLVRLAGVHTTEELIEKVQQRQVPIEPKPKEPRPKPKPKGDKQPGPHGPLPPGHPKVEKKMPEHVARYFEARTGYANYYFNQLNRRRVWDAFQRRGQFRSLTGLWTVQATTQGMGDVRIQLGEQKVTARFGSDMAVDMSKDLGDQLDPPGSGGLLVALAMWKRLLVLGPEQFGDVYYLGTAPIPTQSRLVDVLVATHQVIETRFMFDPQSGDLVGLEMYPDVHVDPCELYFGDYRQVDGRGLPHRIEVRFGDQVFGVLHVQSFEFSSSRDGGQ